MDEPRSYGFDIAAEINALQHTPTTKGRSTRMLVSFPQLRVLLVRMEKCSRWEEHVAPGRVTVQVLRGHIEMEVEGELVDLPAGRLAAVGTRVAHNVNALEESVFLLTVDRDSAA